MLNTLIRPFMALLLASAVVACNEQPPKAAPIVKKIAESGDQAAKGKTDDDPQKPAKGESSAPDSPASDETTPPSSQPPPDTMMSDTDPMMPPTTDRPMPIMGSKAVVASEGCMSTTDIAEGKTTFMQGKYSRLYIVHKPKGYDKSKPWPLVLALPPNGSDSSYWDKVGGKRDIRTLLSDKAILIVTQAREKDWRGDLPTEEAYFDKILADAKKSLCLDTNHIFSMGFSGGGSFSGVLGCTRTDIRAIAVGGAMIYFDKTKCVGKPAAWVTIGDDEAIKERKEYRDFWRERNQCTDQSTVGNPATCLNYACPDKDHPVVFCSHPGGHDWPTFGDDAMWSFFSQF